MHTPKQPHQACMAGNPTCLWVILHTLAIKSIISSTHSSLAAWKQNKIDDLTLPNPTKTRTCPLDTHLQRDVLYYSPHSSTSSSSQCIRDEGNNFFFFFFLNQNNNQPKQRKTPPLLLVVLLLSVVTSRSVSRTRPGPHTAARCVDPPLLLPGLSVFGTCTGRARSAALRGGLTLCSRLRTGEDRAAGVRKGGLRQAMTQNLQRIFKCLKLLLRYISLVFRLFVSL